MSGIDGFYSQPHEGAHSWLGRARTRAGLATGSRRGRRCGRAWQRRHATHRGDRLHRRRSPGPPGPSRTGRPDDCRAGGAARRGARGHLRRAGPEGIRPDAHGRAPGVEQGLDEGISYPPRHTDRGRGGGRVGAGGAACDRAAGATDRTQGRRFGEWQGRVRGDLGDGSRCRLRPVVSAQDAWRRRRPGTARGVPRGTGAIASGLHGW